MNWESLLLPVTQRNPGKCVTVPDGVQIRLKRVSLVSPEDGSVAYNVACDDNKLRNPVCRC